eukprot:12603519-Alexandrium_andersonii.AAC.1
MSASLVGSEMCIRDSSPNKPKVCILENVSGMQSASEDEGGAPLQFAMWGCLLYTSDAADDM